MCFAISPSFSPGSPASSSTRWSSVMVAGTNLGVVLDLLRVLVALAAHRFLLGHALRRLLALFLGRLGVVVHRAPPRSGLLLLPSWVSWRVGPSARAAGRSCRATSSDSSARAASSPTRARRQPPARSSR